MRKKMMPIADQGVRIQLGSKKKTAAPSLAALVENIQVRKEVVAMAKSDHREGEGTFTCSVPSVMEFPKQVNTLDDQAEVAAESCSSAAGSGSSVAESYSSEASQETAARLAGSSEGRASGCEEAMESAETACCVAMEVLREMPNPFVAAAAAAMAQVGAMHLCDHGGEEAAGNGAKPQNVDSAGPYQSQIIRALRDIKVLEEKRNILEGSISNMVAGLSALKETERSKAVRKIVVLFNDLEDIENIITRVLGVIEPWKEVFDNRKRFHEMEGNELKKLLSDFSFSKETVIPGGGNVGPLCADSQILTVSFLGTSANTNTKINAVGVAGVSMPNAVSVPGSSVPGASVQCNKAAGSTNMAVPLTKKLESVGAHGRRDVWDGKRLLSQNVSEVDESQASRRKNEVKIKWLKRCDGLAKEAMHCPVPLTPLYDDKGFWIGGWKIQVKLHINFHVPKHLPNSFFTGKDRGFASIPVNPGRKLTSEWRLWRRVSQHLKWREVVQLESSAPCSKVMGRVPEKLPKQNGKQRASQPRREEKWRVVGKKVSIKKKDTSPKIVVATGNISVLPEGKSWERGIEAEGGRKEREEEG
ncbi:hypothetical protein XELAEV_18022401mg [Xenopus laevis]|uniref:Zinc finger CCHC domain-containing protein n=1 Tax=Xenopus laevis TaxID=8355 RepID=A0A974D339_XENLA|nr:hypothetical protein XELAEV_18022401mg [Xenopus laevis]